MPNTNKLVTELKKKLTTEELKKIPKARFSVKKLDYTYEWYYMRKILESIFNDYLIDGEERDEKTSKVISKLRKLLRKEKNVEKNSEIREKQYRIKDSKDGRSEIKEIETESKPIFTDEQMQIIKKGATEFEKNEQKIQDAIDGTPPEEIGRHPYYDFHKIK